METYIVFFIIAALLNIVAFIWLVITGFKRSVLWGLLIFFLSPLAALIFAITNWFDAKKPFLAYLLTSILVLIPFYMMSSQYDAEFMQRLTEKVESGEIKENEMARYFMNPELLDELDEKAASDEGTMVLDESGQPVPDATTSDTTATSSELAGTDVSSIDAKTSDPSAADKKESEVEVIVEEEAPLPYPRAGEVKPDPLAAKKREVPKDSVKVSLSKISNYKGRYFIVTTKSGTQHRGILIKITKSRIILERKIYGGTFTYKILRSKIKRLDMLKKEYVEDVSS